jgi:hypothetical protein
VGQPHPVGAPTFGDGNWGAGAQMPETPPRVTLPDPDCPSPRRESQNLAPASRLCASRLRMSDIWCISNKSLSALARFRATGMPRQTPGVDHHFQSTGIRRPRSSIQLQEPARRPFPCRPQRGRSPSMSCSHTISARTVHVETIQLVSRADWLAALARQRCCRPVCLLRPVGR